MKCKKCGKTLGEHVFTIVNMNERLEEARQELKDRTCEELVDAYLRTIDFFYRKCAELILLERGHSKKELGLE